MANENNNNNNIDNFIRGQDAKNTVRCNDYASRVLKNFLETKNELRVIQNIPPSELNIYICTFFIEAKRIDGQDYQPALTLLLFEYSFKFVLGKFGIHYEIIY